MEALKAIGYKLHKTLRVYRNQIIAEFKRQEVELTFEQFIILRILNSNCDCIQQDLANILQKDKSIIVRQIDGLLEKKYIARMTNDLDKRKKNLKVTDLGCLKLSQMEKIWDEVNQRLLANITPAEMEFFFTILDKIQKNGLLLDANN